MGFDIAEFFKISILYKSMGSFRVYCPIVTSCGLNFFLLVLTVKGGIFRYCLVLLSKMVSSVILCKTCGIVEGTRVLLLQTSFRVLD